MLADLLQLSGLAALVAAAFLVNPGLGLAVLGAALLIVSFGVGKA